MQRRSFLSSAAGAAGIWAFGARSFAQVVGTNNRVRVALIGCGTRGVHLAHLMREIPGTQLVAVCDVYATHAALAGEWACADLYGDFRRVLDRPDIDAVLVATPDHWHAIPTVLACQADKDVYVEKPLAHNILEGQAMVSTARKHGRIVQTGTQHRSAPHYREVQEIVQSGQLGAVRFVRVWNYMNRAKLGSRRRAGATNLKPTDLNWDFYLGPAPWVPYERSRFLGNFRGYFDYAGGFVTDWGTHRFDSVRQIMGEANPMSIAAAGRRYEATGRGDTPDVVQATVQFPEFTMSYEAIQTSAHGVGGRTPGMKYYRMGGPDDRPHGLALYGTEGTIIVDRIGFDVYPEPIPARGREMAPVRVDNRSKNERRWIQSRDTTDLHLANFFESVRTRRAPAADVAIGHLSTTVPHLINIAYRTGKKLRWEATTETIEEDADSSALLVRKAREPWDVIEGT